MRPPCWFNNWCMKDSAISTSHILKGSWKIHTVCRELCRLRRIGCAPGGVSIFVPKTACTLLFWFISTRDQWESNKMLRRVQTLARICALYMCICVVLYMWFLHDPSSRKTSPSKENDTACRSAREAGGTKRRRSTSTCTRTCPARIARRCGGEHCVKGHGKRRSGRSSIVAT